MNPWREVLRSLQAELDRLSQEIDGLTVLPNGVVAVLPAARFERWAPILDSVTAELGGALVAWVEGSRRAWYGGIGPYVTVRLDAERVQPEITCRFLASSPGDNPATEEEPSVELDAVSPSGIGPSAPSTDRHPVARETSQNAAGAELEPDSPLESFELDAWPYLSGALEPPPLGEESVAETQSDPSSVSNNGSGGDGSGAEDSGDGDSGFETGTETGDEHEDFHLSQIELD